MFTFWHRTATVDAPLSYRARMAFGQLLFDRDMKGMAEREFKAAMTLFPEQWGVYYSFADKLRLAGNCEAAVFYYRKTLFLEPTHETVRTSMIACLLHLGRYRDAEAQAKEALAHDVPHYRLFQRLRVLADSADNAKAPPGTVTVKLAAADTMP